MRQDRQGVSLLAIAAVTLFLGAACSQRKSTDDTDEDTSSKGVNGAGGGTDEGSTSVNSDIPSDSTGGSAPILIAFATTASSAALALQDSGVLDLGAGLVLQDARISIGKIKVKANKEMGAAEKALKEELKAQKKAMEKEIESQKDALEAQKDAIKESYEQQLEDASDEEKDAIKDQMELDLADVERQKAELEADNDAALEAFEADADPNLRWKGPYVFDLVTGVVTPEVPTVDLTDGSYRRIEFKVRPNRDLDGADPLLNNAIYIAGTVEVDGLAVPLTLSMRTEEEFKLMGLNAFKVEPTIASALTIAFNPMLWFEGLDFSTAEINASGTIDISEVSNVEIYKSIRRNVKSSTKFGKDDDGDGDLGDEEVSGDGDEGVAEEEEEEEEEAATDAESEDESED